MEKAFADKVYTKDDFRDIKFEKGEYDNCTFRHCDLQGADFSASLFVDCIFEHCDVSRVKLNNTTFRDVQFRDTKLMGIHFENCNKFGWGFNFERCLLNHSSFYRTQLKKIIFRECQLVEVDFTESDITEGVFDHCNLSGARFEQTTLEKADLRTATAYSINPELNRIKRAKFSLGGVAGLLDRYDIDIEF